MAEAVLKSVENFINTLDQKLEKPVQKHLKNVYSSLAIGLLAATGGAYIHVFTDILKGNILTSFGSLIVLLLLYATPDNGKNGKLRLGYFLGFGLLTGLGLGPLLDMAISINPAIIVTAFMGTCIVFGCFTLASLYAPDRKFLYLGGTLISLLSLMFWMAIINVFMGSRLMFQLNLYAGLALMCAFVLYDTQLIIEKRRHGDTDYIWHSVDLFVDFVDIFRRLLIILAQKEDEASDDKLYSLYQYLVLFVFENVSGAKVILYGDVKEAFKQRENVLYISNHQCTVDWAVANVLAVRQGSLGNLRYMLKDTLRYLPLYGWYFYQHGCIYVRRGRNFRSDITEKGLAYLEKCYRPGWIVIFPEGTRFSVKKRKLMEKTGKYCLERGIDPPFRHLFAPRSRGTNMVLASLKSRLDYVYDVTIAYASAKTTSGSTEAPGMLASVPCESDKLEDWLLHRFVEKERMLSDFYTSNMKFPDLAVEDSLLSLKTTGPAFLFWCSVLAPVLFTRTGRIAFVGVWFFGTIGSVLWLNVKKIA